MNIERVPFQTTHWSVVLASIQGPTRARAERALNELCQIYWKPLYGFLRQKRFAPAEAEDLTQEFFASLLKRQALSTVDPGKGKFRAFLIASLKNFLHTHRRKMGALKRGGNRVVLSLNDSSLEAWLNTKTAVTQTPESIYEREWARTVLHQVRAELQREYAATGKSELFEQLVQFLPGAKPVLPQAAVAVALGTTVSAIKSEVYRLKQRFGNRLRSEITRTVSAPDEVEEEIRDLIRIVSHAG